MPKVSVIIPTYNRSEKVVKAVKSVLTQTYTDYEVLVIDDGSTDNTKVVLAPYYGKIRYIFQANQGVSSARNRGIQMARGEFIAFLDSDDEWLPEKLEKQVNFLKSHDSVFILACLAEGEMDDSNYKKIRQAPNQFIISLQTLFVQNASRYIVKKKCFDECGLFDINLQGPEDWELWLHFFKYGYRFDYVPEPLIRYSVDGISLCKNGAKMLAGEMIIKKRYVDTLPNSLECFRIKLKFLARIYFAAAWNYRQSGDIKKAYYFILKSIFTNILWPRTIDRLKLFISLLNGSFRKYFMDIFD